MGYVERMLFDVFASYLLGPDVPSPLLSFFFSFDERGGGISQSSTLSARYWIFNSWSISPDPRWRRLDRWPSRNLRYDTGIDVQHAARRTPDLASFRTTSVVEGIEE